MKNFLTTIVAIMFAFTPVAVSMVQAQADDDPVNQAIHNLAEDDYLSGASAAGLISYRAGADDQLESRSDQELVDQIRELQDLIIYLNSQLDQ